TLGGRPTSVSSRLRESRCVNERGEFHPNGGLSSLVITDLSLTSWLQPVRSVTTHSPAESGNSRSSSSPCRAAPRRPRWHPPRHRVHAAGSSAGRLEFATPPSLEPPRDTQRDDTSQDATRFSRGRGMTPTSCSHPIKRTAAPPGSRSDV